MQNRRNFLKQAGLLLAGGLVAPQLLTACGGKANTNAAATAAEAATTATKNIGLQLYSLRDMINKEGIQKVLEVVAKMGYKNLENANYDKGKIYGAGFQQRHALLTGAVDDLNVDIGMFFMESLKVGEQVMAGDGIRCRDFNLSIEQLGHIGKFFFPGFQQGKSRFHIIAKQPPFCGKCHPSCAADKERGAERFFQVCNRLADCRLGNIQLPGCFGKGLAAGDCAENLILFQIGIHKRSL